MRRSLALLVLVVGSRLAAQGAPLTIVAPAAPGGGWDQLARAMQHALEAERLAPRVTVENIPGAAGTVGLARVVSGRRGDGASLLVTGLVMVGGVVQNASPVGLADATPIARLVGEYEAIAVPAASPWKSLGDLVAALRADPGAVSFGGGSAGGTDQILVDLLARAAGVDPRRVSYVAFSGGGEARTALLGAQVSAGVSGVGEFAELATAGQVRLLAVSSPARLRGLDVPTIREAGLDVSLANWRGVLAPPGITPRQRADLERLVEGLVRSATWQDELRRRGWEDLWLGGDGFARFIAAEVRRVEALAALKRGEGGREVRAPALPLVLGGLLVVSLALTVTGRRRAGTEAVTPAATGSWRGPALALGGLVTSTLASDLAGFVPASVLLFTMTALAFGEPRRVRVVLVALAFSVAVFAMFRYGLGVPLPLGAWLPGSGR